MVLSIVALAIPAWNCRQDAAGPSPGTSCTPAVVADAVGAMPVILTLPTWDGTGQVMHPDYASIPAGTCASGNHLAITTYPDGNASRELVSAFAANTVSTSWALEAGTPNPLWRDGFAGTQTDPDMLYDPDSRALWLYWRLVRQGWNVVLLSRSRDGAYWEPPIPVDSAHNHLLISPAVVRRGQGDWWMWSVNAGEGCTSNATQLELRRSPDGLHWTVPAPAALGSMPWHLDVEWVPERSDFWTLYVEKAPGSCRPLALWLATSVDGLAWTTYPTPVLQIGVIPEFADLVYRSTFSVDGDSVTLWYSGARYTGTAYEWHSAVSRRAVAELLSSVQQPFVARRAPQAERANLPNAEPDR
jgi:hypothetical protein